MRTFSSIFPLFPFFPYSTVICLPLFRLLFCTISTFFPRHDVVLTFVVHENVLKICFAFKSLLSVQFSVIARDVKVKSNDKLCALKTNKQTFTYCVRNRKVQFTNSTYNIKSDTV